MHKSLAFVTVCVGLCALIAATAGAQINVRQDGTGDHLTIAAALAAASAGDVIEITDDGLYVEDLALSVSGLTLRAANSRHPIVRPATTTAGSVHVSITAPDVYVRGITFDGTGSAGDGIVYDMGLMNSDVFNVRGSRILDCTVTSYQGTGAHALLIPGNTNIMVERCRFMFNKRGVTVLQSDPAFINSCLIFNKSSVLASVDWGINAVDAPSWCGIINCTIDTDMSGPCAVLDLDSIIPPAPPGPGEDVPGLPLPCNDFGAVYMTNCIVANGSPSIVLTGNECGLQANCLDATSPLMPVLPSNNQYGDPRFVDRANDDFDIQAFSPCRNTGDDAFLELGGIPPFFVTTPKVDFDIEGTCRPISAGVDMGAYEATGANAGLEWEFDTASSRVILHFSSPPGLLNGLDAYGGASLTSCPGLPFNGGRLPLALDDLMLEVADPANAAVFDLMRSIGPSGAFDAFINIPPPLVPVISGAEIYVAFVVLDPIGFFQFRGHSIAAKVRFP